MQNVNDLIVDRKAVSPPAAAADREAIQGLAGAGHEKLLKALADNSNYFAASGKLDVKKLAKALRRTVASVTAEIATMRTTLIAGGYQ